MIKVNFLGAARVYKDNTSYLIYGYWEWIESIKKWKCNNVYYSDEICEAL